MVITDFWTLVKYINCATNFICFISFNLHKAYELDATAFPIL